MPARQPELSGGVTSRPSMRDEHVGAGALAQGAGGVGEDRLAAPEIVGVVEGDDVLGVGGGLERRRRPSARCDATGRPVTAVGGGPRRGGTGRQEEGRGAVGSIGAERADPAGERHAQPTGGAGVGVEHGADRLRGAASSSRSSAQAERRRRPAEAAEVASQRERLRAPSCVGDDLHRLEDPVADGQPVVEGREAGDVGGDERTVDPERGDGLGGVAVIVRWWHLGGPGRPSPRRRSGRDRGSVSGRGGGDAAGDLEQAPGLELGLGPLAFGRRSRR